MKRSSAEILALEALAWAAKAGTLADFLARSGVQIDDLRERAGDPELQAAVLEFLLSQDALTKAFCEERGIEANQVHLARRALTGGDFEN